MSLASRRRISELAPEAANGPKKQAQHNADKDRGCQRKGDRPSSSTPVEITGKATKRKMKAAESQDDYACDDKEESQKNERAA
jgi:hypothetical protein